MIICTFREDYTTQDKISKEPSENSKIKITNEAYAVGELLEKILNVLVRKK